MAVHREGLMCELAESSYDFDNRRGHVDRAKKDQSTVLRVLTLAEHQPLRITIIRDEAYFSLTRANSVQFPEDGS